ncbi:MFS transporter [Sebaldella sp. S0638]|uniref:MFS transporter n=1 Tax=Sebaldella sp. S0638 TaxID=2957809 RepID=UPI00209FFBFA|nr:MFS transporter [Sebaldella sp. S0638]MCP1226714.1 MFS transporter [Sebaldella sp. S0638]
MSNTDHESYQNNFNELVSEFNRRYNEVDNLNEKYKDSEPRLIKMEEFIEKCNALIADYYRIIGSYDVGFQLQTEDNDRESQEITQSILKDLDRKLHEVRAYKFSYLYQINRHENLKLKDEVKANKSEILEMMGLFFAIFAFVQINFMFIGGFLEKYNGYRLIFFIVTLNGVLLTVIFLILEVVGVIVYGENRFRVKCESDSKFCKWFPASKAKIKRSYLYTMMILVVFASFTFYMSKDDKVLNYELAEDDKEELEKSIMEKIDREKIKLEIKEELRKK